MQNKAPSKVGALLCKASRTFAAHRAAICGAHPLHSPGETFIMNISLFRLKSKEASHHDPSQRRR